MTQRVGGVRVCVVPKLRGLVSRCKTLLPREKSCPLVKGWGVGCLQTTYFYPRKSPHATTMVTPVLNTECRVWGRRARASVPHHNQV
jgi:hypothetical protein